MKSLSGLFKLLPAALAVGLIVFACEKDAITPEPEAAVDTTQRYTLADIPAEIAEYFTEYELNEILTGPNREMKNRVENRSGSWHLARWTWQVQIYALPFTGSCDAPISCIPPENCPDPSQWQGFEGFYSGSGMWWGLGAYTHTVHGYSCFYAENPPWNATLYYGGSELYGTGVNISQVNGVDGSYVIIAKADMVGGTGIFDGATGYVTHRMYGSVETDFNPATGQPGTLQGVSLGWIYY